jgi:DNA-binding response OmpR family regulator
MMISKKILVVDDDSDILDEISTTLESIGHHLIIACDGSECLGKLSLEKIKPDEYIEKPVMPEALLGCVEKLLEREWRV